MESNNKSRNKFKANQLVGLIINLIIVGIGLGILTGTLLTIIPKTTTENKFKVTNYRRSNNGKDKINLESNYKIIPSLISYWQKISSNYKGLEVSGYALIEDSKYAELNSSKILPAASTIKLYILLITLKMIDEGDLQWNERIKLTEDSIAGGAGWMRYQQLGQEFPVHEIATEMIRVSDNTATNLLIKRIGGIEVINKKLNKIGLKETKLNSLLPDLEGTNITTAKELVLILQLANQGQFLTTKTRDLFREVLSTSTSNRLIPYGLMKGLKIESENIDYQLLIKGFRVFNKTGDIGTIYADAAIIQMPNASDTYVSFIVKGPFNDPRSAELIREMSSIIVPLIKD